MQRLRWCWLLGLVLTCGCKHESTVTLRTSCFDVCVDASAHVDIDAEVAIASDLRDSLERAQAGLSAYTGIAGALTQFVQSMVELKAGLPAGLSYQGSGLYAMQLDPETRLELRFYLPAATSFGAAGSVIDFNVFDPANYFASLGVKTEASISLSGVSTKLSFTFSGVGPGAELLGISPSASSPLPIDIGGFSSHLANLMIGADVYVNHAPSRSNIAFTLVPERSTVAGLGSGGVKLSITDFVGNGLDVAQTVRLDAVELRLQNPGAKYDGLVRASAISSDLAFQMLLSYRASIQGDIALGCLGADLE